MDITSCLWLDCRNPTSRDLLRRIDELSRSYFFFLVSCMGEIRFIWQVHQCINISFIWFLIILFFLFFNFFAVTCFYLVFFVKEHVAMHHDSITRASSHFARSHLWPKLGSQLWENKIHWDKYGFNNCEIPAGRNIFKPSMFVDSFCLSIQLVCSSSTDTKNKNKKI